MMLPNKLTRPTHEEDDERADATSVLGHRCRCVAPTVVPDAAYIYRCRACGRTWWVKAAPAVSLLGVRPKMRISTLRAWLILHGGHTISDFLTP